MVNDKLNGNISINIKTIQLVIATLVGIMILIGFSVGAAKLIFYSKVDGIRLEMKVEKNVERLEDLKDGQEDMQKDLKEIKKAVGD